MSAPLAVAEGATDGGAWAAYGRAVARCCWVLRRYGVQGGAAQELAHDAVTLAWERGAREGDHLARYAARAVLGLLRAQGRQARRFVASTDAVAVAPIAPEPDERLHRAIAALPAGYRHAAQVAMESGGEWPGGRLKVAAHRARRALAGMLPAGGDS